MGILNNFFGQADSDNKRILIVTDTHFDPNRQAGTTMESRAALSDWLLDEFAKLLLKIEHDYIVVVGDLLAKVTVSEKTLLRLHKILLNEKGFILRGNHCEPSMRFGNISSLEFLCSLLPSIELVFNEPVTNGKFHFIPHCFNQELFNDWILKVPNDSYVFVHANYDNNFTVDSDHSLNLSKEQLEYIKSKNSHVYLGHEHKNRELVGLTIIGCLFPTSVSDCLGGDKFCYVLEGDKIEKIKTWSEEDFIEVDHDFLSEIKDQRFIRVNGQCELEEFRQIGRDVAKARATSKAFILSNNVKVKKKEGSTESLESITAFNIVDMLIAELPEQFREDVRSCI